jgi:hypothetical protein
VSRQQKLRDRLPLIEQIQRPAIGIDQRHSIGVDSQPAVDCREDVLQMDRSRGGLLAKPVRRTDHLARPQTAAGEEEKAGSRPVIAPRDAIDARRPSEFARHHDQRVLQSSGTRQIIDQSRQSAVERRKHSPHRVEIVLVRVPAPPGKRDVPDPGFDQPPRE